jgi:hypothetical protein
MHLEVEVRRRSLRVARIADVAEDVARLDACAVDGKRREGLEVSVVELVPLLVTQP